MTKITIRNLDDDVKKRLCERAAKNNRSMEEEVRVILNAAVRDGNAGSRGLASFTSGLFAPLGGVELELPDREPMRDPPDYS